jgi:hypothetical protein
MQAAHACQGSIQGGRGKKVFGDLVMASTKNLHSLMQKYGPHESGKWLRSHDRDYLLGAEAASVPGWGAALDGLWAAVLAFSPAAATTNGQVATFIQSYVKAELIKEYREQESLDLSPADRKARRLLTEQVNSARDRGIPNEVSDPTGLLATSESHLFRMDDAILASGRGGSGSGTSSDSRAELINDPAQPGVQSLQFKRLLSSCLDEIFKAHRHAAHLLESRLDFDLEEVAVGADQIARVRRSAKLPGGVAKLGTQEWGLFLGKLRVILMKRMNAKDLGDLKGLLGGAR